MVYLLQKFHHYLLGMQFNMYTNHSYLKYLVNKSILEGKFCRWLLLFQEYHFEVIVNPRQLNVSPIISPGLGLVTSLLVWKKGCLMCSSLLCIL